MMKNAWASAAMQACHEILYYFPIILLFNHFLGLANLFMAAVVVLLCYMLGFTIGRYALVRYLEWLLCLAIGILVSITLFGLGVGGIVFTILTTIAVVRGYRFRYQPWEVLFSPGAYISSISIYFVTPMIFMFFPELKVYSTSLYWAGLYCIVHALFTFNFKQVEMASQNRQGGQSTALNVRRANRIGVGVIVIILFIIIHIERLLLIAKAFIYRIMEWLSEFFSKPQTEEPLKPEEPPANPGGMSMEEPHEKSALAEIFDMIIYYAAYIVVFLVAIALLYFIIVKLLLPLFSRLVSTARLTRELQVGYSDEEEKIEAPQIGKWIRGLIQRGHDRPEPRDNSERVRYLYSDTVQTAIKRGYDFKQSYTPLEIEQNWQALKSKHRLPSQLIALYNKARYGEIQITDQEVGKLKDTQ